jgi:DNA polymerase
MDRPPPLTLPDQIAAASEWWREAGVDAVFLDEPQAWLAPDEPESETPTAKPPKPAEPAAPPPPSIGGDEAGWPRDADAFARWWLEEPSLDDGGTFPRIAPRGAAGAELMVLVPMPEAVDREELLSGAEGRLVDNMLAAMGIKADSSYIAAALPRHMPMPDWQGLAERGLGSLLRHHCAVIRPDRLLVMGQALLPLLGHDGANGPASIRETKLGEVMVPTLATFAPERLLDHPKLRADLWRRWLDFSQ